MTDDPSTPRPGDRRLDRPPSERYRPTPPAGDGVAPSGSTARSLGAGAAAAAAWVVATVVCGGVLAISTGLLVVAAAFGRVIGLAAAWGGGPGLAREVRLGGMVGLIGIGFVLGQLGIWAFGRLEGGVLPPIEYLLTTFGVVAPLQLVVALAIGWWTAR